jgi:hypothetical protein
MWPVNLRIVRGVKTSVSIVAGRKSGFYWRPDIEFLRFSDSSWRKGLWSRR